MLTCLPSSLHGRHAPIWRTFALDAFSAPVKALRTCFRFPSSARVIIDAPFCRVVIFLTTNERDASAEWGDLRFLVFLCCSANIGACWRSSLLAMLPDCCAASLF